MNGKFVSYLRVSTKQQGQSGLGLEAQKSAIMQFLNGGDWVLVDEFIEVESGKNHNNRPELQKAIHLAKLTGAKLLISKLDRLSRNASFLLSLKDSNIDFVCCDNPNANSLTIGILALVAQDEAERISQRTKAALAEAKLKKTKLGNPNGAEHLKHLGNNEAVAAIKEKAWVKAESLREIFEKLIVECTTLRGMAKKLNDMNILTPRGENIWHPQTVSRCLKRLELNIKK